MMHFVNDMETEVMLFSMAGFYIIYIDRILGNYSGKKVGARHPLLPPSVASPYILIPLFQISSSSLHEN